MDLGNDKIFRLLLKYSIPAITAMFVNAVYNMADRIFISYGVGADAFSGLTVTGPISIVLLAFSMLVGLGAAARISIELGRGDKDEAERILGNAFILLIITSIVVMIIGQVFLMPILYFFGASGETINYAVEYMRVVLAGFPFIALNFGLYHMTRASGNPGRAMLAMLLGAVLNIFLDFIFIMIFGWGVKGAAFATVISQCVSMLWVLRYFIGRLNTVVLRPVNFKPCKKTAAHIYAIGVSPFMSQVSHATLGAIANNQLLKYGGNNAIGAFGAIHMVIMLFAMPMFGMNQGAQPVLGYNYGAKKYDRVKLAMKYTVLMAFSIGLLGWIFAQTTAHIVINFFTNSHAGINQYAIHGLRVIMLMFPLGAVQIVCAVFFQAIGKAKITLFLSMLRQVILLIPLYFILPHFMGVEGIWYSTPIADLLSFIITVTVVWFGMRNVLREK